GDNPPFGGSYDPNTDGTPAVQTCVTGNNGDCSFTNVALGHYWVIETVTPNGYGTAAPQAVNIGLGGTSGTGSTVFLTFNDPQIPGTINIHKDDSTADAPLAGAAFGLFIDNAPTGGS